MGLDTSHDCWHGSYIAFTRWRNKLAEVADYYFAKVGDPPIHECAMIDWGHLPDGSLVGDWGDTKPNDPLIYLIAHSDCDGVLHPPHAALLADRLEELLPKLPDDDVGGHIGNWRAKTQTFIDGLRRAVAAGEDVDFH